ncbi:MAG: cysteine desulfurase NifS [Desulfatiglans sp.]|nr:cysteine desulfurase NifS [Desulfatiglans sp.]
MKQIYMDYAATTPVRKEVLDEILPFFSENFGNPSSLHTFGQDARYPVESAREKIASAIGATPDEIVFTSGGTESNNFAVKGIANARQDKGRHIITSAIEHHAILEPCHFLEKNGFEVTYLPVDSKGLVDPDDVLKAIKNETILISVMHANNEIGTIQPIKEIGAIARERGILFHSDVVQTLGRMPINVDDLNLDLVSASGHKIYGPKGVGFIYIRKGTRVTPFMHGGEQERGRRASTHNVPGIIGIGKAAELAMIDLHSETERITALRDKMISGILANIEDCRLNGHPEKRLFNNIHVSIDYIEGESLLLYLDMEGIACSTGSACSSASLEPSHVLTAIGVSPDTAYGALRFTLGRLATEEDVNFVIDTLPGIVKKLRDMSPVYKNKGKA